MDVTLPLDQMSNAEKLRAMEALWADLSRNEKELESPLWHGQGILQERHEREVSGEGNPGRLGYCEKQVDR